MPVRKAKPAAGAIAPTAASNRPPPATTDRFQQPAVAPASVGILRSRSIRRACVVDLVITGIRDRHGHGIGVKGSKPIRDREQVVVPARAVHTHSAMVDHRQDRSGRIPICPAEAGMTTEYAVPFHTGRSAATIVTFMVGLSLAITHPVPSSCRANDAQGRRCHRFRRPPAPGRRRKRHRRCG